MSIQKKIISELNDDLITWDSLGELNGIFSNWTNYFNGSWGYDLYDNFMFQMKSAYRIPTKVRRNQRLRSIVINSFTGYVAKEFGCSYGHAQKSIVKAIPKADLAKLTKEFQKEMEEFYSEIKSPE